MSSKNVLVQKLDIDINQKKLKAEKLQTFTQEYKVEGKGKKKRLVGVLLIDAPCEKVWEILEDWDSMGDYIPNLEYYKTIHDLFHNSDDRDNIKVSLIEGKLSIPLLSIEYTLKVTFDKSNFTAIWNLVKDDELKEFNSQNIIVKKSTAKLRNIEGYEYLEPYNNGNQTVYYYAPIVETFVPLPGFAEKMISKTTTSGYMFGIRDRVMKLIQS